MARLCSCQKLLSGIAECNTAARRVLTLCSSAQLQHNTRHSSRVVHRACARRDGDLPHFLRYAAAPALGDCAADLQHWQSYGCLHIVTMQL